MPFRATALCAFALTTASLWSQSKPAADPSSLSGTWFGDFVVSAPDGKLSHNTAVLVLDDAGSGIPGSVGPTIDRQSPISAATLDAGTLRFHIDAAGGMDFTLHVAAGRIEGAALGKNMKADLRLRPAPGLVPHHELVKEISAADEALFAAFTSCNAEAYAGFLSKDLEFYHDHTGKTGFEENVNAVRNRCAEGIRLERELDASSVVINAAHGYGAIQAGLHRFYSIGNDGSRQLTATARFTNVWSKESGHWQLVRSVSFDHR